MTTIEKLAEKIAKVFGSPAVRAAIAEKICTELEAAEKRGEIFVPKYFRKRLWVFLDGVVTQVYIIGWQRLETSETTYIVSQTKDELENTVFTESEIYLTKEAAEAAKKEK